MKLAGFLEWLGLNQTRCYHCGIPFFRSELYGDLPTLRLCPACQKIIGPYFGPACRLCGLPAQTDQNGKKAGLCVYCAKNRPVWSGSAYYGLYSGALRDLLLRLKFDGELALTALFADFLAFASQCLPRPDCLTPVPQYSARLRKRGFNQAHEICRSFASFSGFKFDYSLLSRISPGLPQEGLTAWERRLNLANAFKAKPAVKDKSVWLVDDVMTTGATLSAATDALLKAGAKSVYVLFVARTPLEKPIEII